MKFQLIRQHERRLKLEEARDLFQFEVDMEEEEAWVIEKQRICQAGVIAKDMGGVISLQQKHKVGGRGWCLGVVYLKGERIG